MRMRAKSSRALDLLARNGTTHPISTSGRLLLIMDELIFKLFTKDFYIFHKFCNFTLRSLHLSVFQWIINSKSNNLCHSLNTYILCHPMSYNSRIWTLFTIFFILCKFKQLQFSLQVHITKSSWEMKHETEIFSSVIFSKIVSMSLFSNFDAHEIPVVILLIKALKLVPIHALELNASSLIHNYYWKIHGAKQNQ